MHRIRKFFRRILWSIAYSWGRKPACPVIQRCRGRFASATAWAELLGVHATTVRRRMDRAGCRPTWMSSTRPPSTSKREKLYSAELLCRYAGEPPVTVSTEALVAAFRDCDTAIVYEEV